MLQNEEGSGCLHGLPKLLAQQTKIQYRLAPMAETKARRMQDDNGVETCEFDGVVHCFE
jgi:hypothetical protein